MNRHEEDLNQGAGFPQCRDAPRGTPWGVSGSEGTPQSTITSDSARFISLLTDQQETGHPWSGAQARQKDPLDLRQPPASQAAKVVLAGWS